MEHESVFLGQTADGPLDLSKEARETHLHVLGLSRQGKSYFLEHLIRQDIEQGAGICLIDPHGDVYDHMVDWLAAGEWYKTRRIHLINPANGDWSVGFNPLCIEDPNISARVGAMIEACQKVWGDKESTGHKTLANLLDMVFTTLAYHRLSLSEASLLTSLDHIETRRRLVEETGDAALLDSWSQLDHLKPHEFVGIFNAVANRLRALVGSPGVSPMLSQTEDVIDFKTCMDQGHVVLVNLAHRGRIRKEDSQTVGALITADLFHSAQTRDTKTAKEHPFYCYIDECGQYLNETIVQGLDETAKYGLHYILSHQRLAQLGLKHDDPIRAGVMEGTQSKIVFLQENRETNAELAELLFGKTIDLERPKDALIKPGIIGYSREWLNAEGEAESKFSAEISNMITSAGLGISTADVIDSVSVSVESSSDGESEGFSQGYSESRSKSRHEALIPILADLPGGMYSKDELLHLSMVQIRLLQKRQALAYRADDRKAVQFATADVHPARPTVEQIRDFFKTLRNREPSAKSVEAVDVQVKQRRMNLLKDTAPQTLATDDFFEDIEAS